MMPDFDVIIVGSGPAGVSAAYPLVESGLRVLMVDGGRQAAVSPPTQDFLSWRAKDSNQWKCMIGEDYHALCNRDAVSPKLRTPTHKHVFQGFNAANRIDTHNFVAIGSLAPGGLSNAWGCGVARLSTRELSEFPCHGEDMDRSYQAVARRIGISGGCDDDLSDYFGLDDCSQPPIKMDALHEYIYSRYAKQRVACAALGFRLGRSRIAVLSTDLAERSACDRCGNCLWGCHRRALYSSADELLLLLQHKNFHYDSGLVVERIVQIENALSIEGRHEKAPVYRSITAHKIILAAGTLATTRLALEVLKLTKPVHLLSCPTAAFLLWLPRFLGTPRTLAFGLGQLSFVLAIKNGVLGFGSTFGTTGIPISEFVGHLPLRRRYGIDLLRGLLSSCLVGNLFLPGHLSTAKAALKNGCSLKVDGGYNDEVPFLMAEAARRLRKAYWRLGAVLLPKSFTVGRPGGDIHYAGTLPMREQPALGETNAIGELSGVNGVHIVDGACLPILPGKSHALSIMANADRIGREIALRFQRG